MVFVCKSILCIGQQMERMIHVGSSVLDQDLSLMHMMLLQTLVGKPVLWFSCWLQLTLNQRKYFLSVYVSLLTHL